MLFRSDVFTKYGGQARAVLDALLAKYADEGVLNLDDTNVGKQLTYDGVSSVGFAEVRLRPEGAAADVRVDEVVRMPSDLLSMYGADNLAHPLTVLIDRQLVRPVPPTRIVLPLRLSILSWPTFGWQMMTWGSFWNTEPMHRKGSFSCA